MITNRFPTSLLFCLILLIGGEAAHAQYRFDHWTTDNGLPQNSVHGTLQTRDGYMWFTTFDGLVRFDGLRFTVFNKSNSPGLASNQFGTVYEDRFGDLWATLNTGGIARMHRGRFTTYTKEQGLPLDSAGICDDGQGNMVIYGNGQLFRWWDGRFEPFNELSLSGQQPSDVGLPRLPPADCWWEGDRWVCYSSGRTRSWAAAELPVQGIYGVTMGDNRDYWFTSPKGVVRFREGGVAELYDERNGLPGMNPSLVWGRPRPLQAISRDAAGSLWLTDLYSMQSELLSLRAPEGWDVVDNYGGFADTEGNYWFGTNGNGLFRARKQTVTAYTKAQGLNAREVYPLLEARDGTIWIGTRRDGLFRFKDGVFTNYTGAGAFEKYVSSLYEDRAGQLWVNGRNGDTWRFTGASFVREIWKGVAYGSLGAVRTMCEDDAGAYWIGSEGGVVRYQNGVAVHYTTKDGLAGNDTKVIVPDLTDGVWLGGDGGLTHYNDGKFTAWTEKDGLPGAAVRALKQDDDGTLWIGAYDSGLARFKDGRFTRYTTKDGLYDDGVFQILEDDYGWLWMSCNRGVYRVRKQELNDFADGKSKEITSLAYTRGDGMPSAQCNSGRSPAGIKTRDGKLWFPTIGGVAVIDPSSVRFNTKPPPVVIEEMHIDNQPVGIESWETAIRDTQSAIRVEHGQENFEIRYTAVSFINAENLRFKYKLEGLDHDWVEAGTRRTAYFSHVPPGDYTFKVIAANSAGVWNTEGKSLRVSVLPPFYRTWWFLTLAALTLGAALGAIYKYRVTQLEGRQAAQQAFTRQLIDSQEAERKRIAAELHDSLGQNLLIVKNWALVGLNALSKDNPAREHLTEISETTSLALDEVREIAHNLRPYQLERLGLTNTLDYMMRNVRNSSDIEFAVELENIDGLLPRDSEINLYRVVQEVINNVIKHSEAGEARLAISRSAGGVQVLCQDNGKGFDPAAAASSRQSGMGLSGLSERVRILGGNYTIDSAPGAGTTITINVNTTQ